MKTLHVLSMKLFSRTESRETFPWSPKWRCGLGQSKNFSNSCIPPETLGLQNEKKIEHLREEELGEDFSPENEARGKDKFM